MPKVTIQTAIDEQVWVETKKAAREGDIPLRAYITTALQEHLARQRPKVVKPKSEPEF